MTQRYLVVLNGSAGTCAREPQLEARVRAALGDGRPGVSVDVMRTQTPEQAIGAARVARLRNYTAVVAVGGDGTHHWLVDELAGGDVPLGLVPLGTANDLAIEYGIPTDVEEACRIIRRGAQTRIDLITAAGKAFATAGGMGLANDVAEGVCAARRRSRLFHLLMRLLGGWIYTLYMLYTVLVKRDICYQYTLWGPGSTVREVDAYMALFMNQSFLGKNFRAVPAADNRDGVFDVLLVKKAPGRFSRLHLIAALTHSLRGTHIGRHDVEVVRAERLTVTTPQTSALFADGELVADGTRFELGIQPRALPLVVPESRAERGGDRRPARSARITARRRRQRESAAA